ncbi:NACHT, LRR and PYD domains-containing protein 3-like isoform X2 [Hemicordylus capensis]|nr:NACHT, LRR and PYD domains-containing protein 3-like isoform X2 [Hemicordylus capensis]XP_053158577.1 NACHT, LRR and PYD domains-containing protein 3-like isoform X2 [Hemicordylus capensis]XP_053158578.1 NACHT, LRR and PYD domains-containing protein 3-like isoform X2 [Hemicordylus capensis]
MESRRAIMHNLLLDALEDLGQDEFDKFKFKLRTTAAPGDQNIPFGRLEKSKREELVELLVEFYEDKAATLMETIFEDIGLKNNASELRKVVGERVQGYKKKYAKNVMEEYQLTEDRNSLFGESTPLNSRYIELLIIKKHRPQKEREHELLAIGRKHLEILEKTCSDYSTDIKYLFKPDESGVTPRTVVLQGPAGIGKTMTIQKIMLDWAAGELYQDMFDYVFCLRCRELSLTEEANSLIDLIVEQCQDTYAPVKEILACPEKLLFIIDGFDELCFSLEPTEDHICNSPYSKVSMKDILNSLLRKKLLPKSYLLITTRPGAAERLQECLKFPRFMEILGFSEKGRHKYFFNFFKDERKANIALRFIDDTTAVSTICFIPIVCWIICHVIKVELETEDEIKDTLDTTTKVFVQFSHNLLKHDSRKLKKSSLGEFRKLCSMAQAGILEQKIFFEEKDLKDHSLDGSDLKDLFLDRRTFQKGIGRYSLYSFLHLCFQEFFAAMWYILQEEPAGASDNNEGDLKRLLIECEKPGNEHLTLTLRFIFGLSSEKVRVFLEQTLQCKTSDLVKPLLLQRAEEIAAEHPPRKGYCLLNFFHSLFESQEAEFAERVMHSFQTIDLSYRAVSMLDCRVLAFCLQHSSVQDHSIDLTFCRLKSHHIKALAPGIKTCTTLEFGSNKLGNSGVKVLCAILKELACNITILDLSENYLTDACAQELCATLSTSHTLQRLSLLDNSFTETSLPFILHLMETCTSLSLLRLDGYGFGKKGRKRLRQQEEKIKARPFLLLM